MRHPHALVFRILVPLFLTACSDSGDRGDATTTPTPDVTDVTAAETTSAIDTTTATDGTTPIDGTTPTDAGTEVVVGPPLAEAVVGAAGATLTIDSGDFAGVSLVIPADALSDATHVSLAASEPGDLGMTAVSGTLRLEPAGTTFTIPVLLTMPLTALPAKTTIADVVITKREANGVTTYLRPRAIDADAKTATVAITSFCDVTFTASDPLGGFSIWPSTVSEGEAAEVTAPAGCTIFPASLGRAFMLPSLITAPNDGFESAIVLPSITMDYAAACLSPEGKEHVGVQTVSVARAAVDGPEPDWSAVAMAMAAEARPAEPAQDFRPHLTITASPPRVRKGESTDVSISPSYPATAACTVRRIPGAASFPMQITLEPEGGFTDTPTAPATVYRIDCGQNFRGGDLTVPVVDPLFAGFEFTFARAVDAGSGSDVMWQGQGASEDAPECSILGDLDPIGCASGMKHVEAGDAPIVIQAKTKAGTAQIAIAPAAISTLRVTPTRVRANGVFDLTWSTWGHLDACRTIPSIGAGLGPSGTRSIGAPSQPGPIAYEMTCTRGSDGFEVSRVTMLDVLPESTDIDLGDFGAHPKVVFADSNGLQQSRATLSWVVYNAESCHLVGGGRNGAVSHVDGLNVLNVRGGDVPGATSVRYTLTCTDAAGKAQTQEATLEVDRAFRIRGVSSQTYPTTSEAPGGRQSFTFELFLPDPDDYPEFASASCHDEEDSGQTGTHFSYDPTLKTGGIITCKASGGVEDTFVWSGHYAPDFYGPPRIFAFSPGALWWPAETPLIFYGVAAENVSACRVSPGAIELACLEGTCGGSVDMGELQQAVTTFTMDCEGPGGTDHAEWTVRRIGD